MREDNRYGIDPSKLMLNIINNVKGLNNVSSNLPVSEEDNPDLLANQWDKYSQLKSIIPITASAYLTEPPLSSRFKILGRFIVTLRKFGARLFAKWYTGPVFDQQSRLNISLIKSIEMINSVLEDQMKINSALVMTKNNYQTELQCLKNNIQSELNETKYTIELVNFPVFPYQKFNEKFGGLAEKHKEIYNSYFQYLRGCSNVLDIGCGRGVFLEHLKESGINGYGIDSDKKLVEWCKGKELQVIQDDAINHLKSLNIGEIDGIYAGHIIEHLPLGLKQLLLELCYEKLASGGHLIIQTPNTISPYVLHNLYYLDPTHQAPLHPETYKLLAENAGFTVIDSYLSEKITDDLLKIWNPGYIEPEGQEIDQASFYNFTLIVKK
ncbi:MAG: class I SAM-dependent methyltransferase [Clostridia bacterium]|nr:class I SAM-dependent methyltransferase [Clostridia bacterium]